MAGKVQSDQQLIGDCCDREEHVTDLGRHDVLFLFYCFATSPSLNRRLFAASPSPLRHRV